MAKNFIETLFSSEQKESKSIDEKPIEDIKKDVSKKEDKIFYLKNILEKAKDLDKKRQIRALLIDEIKSKNKGAEFFLGYDSFTEGVEPIYFWFLDFLRSQPPAGLSFEVDKTKEEFDASIGSAFYGDMGTRATRMQEQAMKMLVSINTVIRSIINLIYDLKEFKMRLETYDDLKSPDKEKVKIAELGLKQSWLDNVDMKRGRGSIHQMAQQLNFVTIRDAFLYAKDVKQVDSMDLNDRVKRILKPRLDEYTKWKQQSGIELRKRYNIEKSYLKSQVGTLKLYADWTKPYLIAAQKLGMKDFNSPHIVSLFNNIEMHLSLFGKKLINIQSMIDSEELPPKAKSNAKYYACIEIEIMFRSVPHSVRQTQSGMQYTQGGRAEVKIRSYTLKEDDLKYLKEQELFEGLELVDEVAGTALREIHDDIEEFLKEDKPKEKEKPKKVSKSIFQGAKELITPIKQTRDSFKDLFSIGVSEDWVANELKKKAQGTAALSAFIVYDVYKKAHGMLSW